MEDKEESIITRGQKKKLMDIFFWSLGSCYTFKKNNLLAFFFLSYLQGGRRALWMSAMSKDLDLVRSLVDLFVSVRQVAIAGAGIAGVALINLAGRPIRVKMLNIRRSMPVLDRRVIRNWVPLPANALEPVFDLSSKEAVVLKADYQSGATTALCACIPWYRRLPWPLPRFRGFYFDGVSAALYPTANAWFAAPLRLRSEEAETIFQTFVRREKGKQRVRRLLSSAFRYEYPADAPWYLRWMTPKPILIVVDHCEQLLLHHGEGALTLIRNLAQCHVRARYARCAVGVHHLGERPKRINFLVQAAFCLTHFSCASAGYPAFNNNKSSSLGIFPDFQIGPLGPWTLTRPFFLYP